MSVLAVLDLMKGVIVRGIAGERAKYRPIQSQIAADASPASVARGLISRFGIQEVYLADLDAIAGNDPQWQIYETVAKCGLRLLVDAGIGECDRAREFAEFASRNEWLCGAVVGLESVPSPALLPPLVDILSPTSAIFSLDLRHGRPLTTVEPWRNAPPEEIAGSAVEAGFRRLIVLDLAAVGVDQGPTTGPMCRVLRNRFPPLEIISGGGVRSHADIQELLAAGCNRVMVASALHDGRLERDRK